jgi:hypothetical protein
MSVGGADRITERPAGIISKSGFLACAGLLTVFAVAFQVMATHKDIQFRKLSLPLKKPLDQFDTNQLYPYELAYKFPPIKPEILDALGTRDYISLAFTDRSITTPGPEQLVNMFVTYYTGNADQVPHVPEVCYLGSGYRTIDSSFREVPMPSLGAGATIPVQLLEFERSALLGRESKVVMYTFHANGQFCAERKAVLRILGDPLSKYAYFSKLELTFGSSDQFPTRDKAIKAGERFLQVVVPRLLRDHWPDWENAIRATSQPNGNVNQAATTAPA